MSLPYDYLEYPKRRHGMDHDRYEWSMLRERKPVTWPGGARIALWVVPALEFFPLDQPAEPFKAPGGMVTPYPDLRHYTLRDYGSRVGIFRIMKVLDGLGIRASVAVNAAISERYPFLIAFVVRCPNDVVESSSSVPTILATRPSFSFKKWLGTTRHLLIERSDLPVR